MLTTCVVDDLVLAFGAAYSLAAAPTLGLAGAVALTCACTCACARACDETIADTA